MDLFTIFIAALITNNIVLSGFLGICSYLGVSKNTKSSVGMGCALTFVTLFAAIISFFLDKLLVAFDITYLRTVCFILVIASLVQFVEMVIKRFIPSLYKSLGIFLPLITTNCIVLFVTKQIVSMDFLDMLVYALGTALGYFVMIFIFSNIREKLSTAPVARGFQGVAIALITTALMAMAMIGFRGLI